MLRRLHLPLICTGVLAVGLLAGCAAPVPAQDTAALSDWGELIIDASGGGMGGMMSTDASAEGIRMDFPTPTAFASVELRCKGADRASFTLRYTGTESSVTTTQEIVCHDGGLLTPIAIPTAVGELTAFAANATSPDGEGYWIAIPQE